MNNPQYKIEYFKQLEENKKLQAAIDRIQIILDNLNNNINRETKKEFQQFNEIVKCVCAHFRVDKSNIFSGIRKRETHIKPRHFFFYFMATTTKFRLQEIIDIFNVRAKRNGDHSGVIHARNSIRKLIEIKDKETIEDYNAIKEQLLKSDNFIDEYFEF